MARALDIDENRYTRYERAEVEPDLSLIRRICDVLTVTPNDLLARVAASDPLTTSRIGFGEMASDERMPPPDQPGTVVWSASTAEAAAWKLSSLVARIRTTGLETDRTAVGAPQPLVFLQSATTLFRDLSRRPIEAISEIVRDPAIVSAGPEVTRDVNALAIRIADGLSQSGKLSDR